MFEDFFLILWELINRFLLLNNLFILIFIFGVIFKLSRFFRSFCCLINLFFGLSFRNYWFEDFIKKCFDFFFSSILNKWNIYRSSIWFLKIFGFISFLKGGKYYLLYEYWFVSVYLVDSVFCSYDIKNEVYGMLVFLLRLDS